MQIGYLMAAWKVNPVLATPKSKMQISWKFSHFDRGSKNIFLEMAWLIWTKFHLFSLWDGRKKNFFMLFLFYEKKLSANFSETFNLFCSICGKEDENCHFCFLGNQRLQDIIIGKIGKASYIT